MTDQDQKPGDSDVSISINHSLNSTNQTTPTVPTQPIPLIQEPETATSSSEKAKEYSKEIQQLEEAYKRQSGDTDPHSAQPTEPSPINTTVPNNTSVGSTNSPALAEPVLSQPVVSPQPTVIAPTTASVTEQLPLTDFEITSSSTPQQATVYIDPTQAQQLSTEKPKHKISLPSRRVIISGSVALVVLIIVPIIYSALFNGVKYQNYTVSNTGYNYSFDFYNNASEENLDSRNVVRAIINSPILVLAMASTHKENCSEVVPNTSVVAYVSYQGSKYPVCQTKNKAFMFSLFKINGVWQEVAVYSPDTVTPVNSSVALKTIKSTNVNAN